MSGQRFVAFVLIVGGLSASITNGVAPLLGCGPPPAPDTPPPHPSGASCESACGNVRALPGKCIVRLTPRSGGTCEDSCRLAETNALDFRVGCLTAATDCDAVAFCLRP